MRILIFEQRYTGADEAGIGRFHAFANEWAKQGHEVAIIAGTVSYVLGERPKAFRGKIFSKRHERERLQVVRVFDNIPGYRTFLGRLFSYWSYLFFAFFAALFSKRPDVVIASSPPIFTGVLGWKIARLRRARFVFEVRDLWPDEAIELGFLKNHILISMSFWLERFLYARADHIVVNSPGIKEFLTAKKGVAKKKITNVPNPTVTVKILDSPPLPDIVKEWSGKTIVLYAGAMSAVYDFDIVLDIAKETSDKNLFFVFLGSGRQKSRIQERAERERIKNVQFLGPVPQREVRTYVSAADICIVPLRDLSLLNYIYATKIFQEYMPAGKPIALAGGGVNAALVCQKAQCGVCVPPGNKSAFRNALLDLAGDTAKRVKFGTSGQRYAEKHFNAERLTGVYFRVICGE